MCKLFCRRLMGASLCVLLVCVSSQAQSIKAEQSLRGRFSPEELWGVKGIRAIIGREVSIVSTLKFSAAEENKVIDALVKSFQSLPDAATASRLVRCMNGQQPVDGCKVTRKKGKELALIITVPTKDVYDGLQGESLRQFKFPNVVLIVGQSFERNAQPVLDVSDLALGVYYGPVVVNVNFGTGNMVYAALSKDPAAEGPSFKADAVTFYNQGATLLNSGRNAEAAPAFKQAIAADPDMAEAYFLLGVCLASSRSTTSDAISALQKYVQVGRKSENLQVAKQIIESLQAMDKKDVMPLPAVRQTTAESTTLIGQQVQHPGAVILDRISIESAVMIDKENRPKCSLRLVSTADMPKLEGEIQGMLDWPKEYNPPAPCPYSTDDKERIVAEGMFYTKFVLKGFENSPGATRSIGRFIVDNCLNPLMGIWDCRKEGAVHTIIGNLKMFEYEFQSDEANPLVFKLTKSGYEYVEGKGVVNDLKTGNKYTFPR